MSRESLGKYSNLGLGGHQALPPVGKDGLGKGAFPKPGEQGSCRVICFERDSENTKASRSNSAMKEAGIYP